MSICNIRSYLLWSSKDIDGLASDIFRIFGADRTKEFSIKLTLAFEGRLFSVEINGPEEYKETIEKMSRQQIV